MDGISDGTRCGSARAAGAWFMVGPAFGQPVRRRFGALLLTAAATGAAQGLADAPRGLSSRSAVLLDQLPRNCCRGDSAGALATDDRALAIAEHALAEAVSIAS